MIVPIDPNAAGYVWHAVVRQVLALVKAGTLKPGARLPSIPDGAHQFGVSTKTVQRAYGWLGERGVVRSFFGRGTFVANPLPDPLPDPPDGDPL